MWCAVSDWMKMQDAVMNDPLTSVDAEAISNQVNESARIMHKSVRTFAEFPGKSRNEYFL